MYFHVLSTELTVNSSECLCFSLPSLIFPHFFIIYEIISHLTEPEKLGLKLFFRFRNDYPECKSTAVTPPNDPAGRINSQQLRDRQVSLSFLTSTARNLSPEYPEHSPLFFSSATSSSLRRLMGQNIILSTAYWKSTYEKGEGEINVRKSCKQARLNCSHLHLPTLQIAK